jgi:hypothetical protein
MGNLDPVFASVVGELFGSAVDPEELSYEIHKASPDPSSVHVRGAALKKKKREAQIGLANNTFGATAGALATGQAYKLARNVTPATMSATRTGRLMNKMKVNPKVAIPTVGAAMVGTQAVNGALDAQSAQYFAREVKNMRPKKKGPSQVDKLKNQIVKAYQEGQISRTKANDLSEKLIKSVESEVHDVTWSADISKMDTDKKQVFGWASVTHVDGAKVIDRQKDYMPLDELEKSAYEYVVESRAGGDMHRRVNKGLFGTDKPYKVAEMIESMVITPEKLEAMGLPGDSVNPGWWVGYQIHDDEQWALIKAGKRKGFSVHGAGKRTPVEA